MKPASVFGEPLASPRKWQYRLSTSASQFAWKLKATMARWGVEKQGLNLVQSLFSVYSRTLIPKMLIASLGVLASSRHCTIRF